MAMLRSESAKEAQAARDAVRQYPGYPQRWLDMCESVCSLPKCQSFLDKCYFTLVAGSIIIATSSDASFAVIAHWRNNTLQLHETTTSGSLENTIMFQFTPERFIACSTGQLSNFPAATKFAMFDWYANDKVDWYRKDTPSLAACLRTLIVGLDCYPKSWPQSYMETAKLRFPSFLTLAATEAQTVLLQRDEIYWKLQLMDAKSNAYVLVTPINQGFTFSLLNSSKAAPANSARPEEAAASSSDFKEPVDVEAAEFEKTSPQADNSQATQVLQTNDLEASTTHDKSLESEETSQMPVESKQEQTHLFYIRCCNFVQAPIQFEKVGDILEFNHTSLEIMKMDSTSVTVAGRALQASFESAFQGLKSQSFKLFSYSEVMSAVQAEFQKVVFTVTLKEFEQDCGFMYVVVPVTKKSCE
jgi:hypothetical protein